VAFFVRFLFKNYQKNTKQAQISVDSSR